MNSSSLSTGTANGRPGDRCGCAPGNNGRRPDHVSGNQNQLRLRRSQCRDRPRPIDALLDLLVMVTLQRMVWESGADGQIPLQRPNRLRWHCAGSRGKSTI